MMSCKNCKKCDRISSPVGLGLWKTYYRCQIDGRYHPPDFFCKNHMPISRKFGQTTL